MVVSQHKRMAMGEKVNSCKKPKKYKDGGAVKGSCSCGCGCGGQVKKEKK